MTDPNPIRTLPSRGVVDQKSDNFPICADMECEMVSIKVNSDQIRYVEQCRVCGWIDGVSLSWWADNSIKESGSKLAQRIAVAASTQPFAFVQPSGADLTMDELVQQALGAASMCWSRTDLMQTGTFNVHRAKSIMAALRAEMVRYQQIEAGKALSEARRRVQELYASGPDANPTAAAVLEAIR